MQDHFISAGRVFAASFIVTLATSISTAGVVTWAADFWTPMLIAATSAALKLAINSYLTTDVAKIQQ